ncbi:MAG: Rieske 2Fe-2S domain-containing protein [Bacteroidales bacterium]|nr:Rieske 2Fe-2S domain-containing protein [Bacteroidales bacterium]MDZ4204693.1 Rieske 2Fe-2S domain-containing protein [Bacteroidales bacterium]
MVNLKENYNSFVFLYQGVMSIMNFWKTTSGAMQIVLIALMVLALPSCDKDDENEIPFTPTNIYIDPNSTINWELNSPGGWIYLSNTAPSKGIIVYRSSMDDFMAFERTCSHDPREPAARVVVESSSITAACPVCSSKFILLDGSPFSGPARRPLKQYRTSYNGATLHIFN